MECHIALESHLGEQLMDLTARQYHYGGREASPTHTGDLQSMLLALHQVLRHLRAVKDLSHAQELTGNVRSSFKIT